MADEPGTNGDEGMVTKITLATIFSSQQQMLRELTEMKGEIRSVRDRTTDILSTLKDHETRIRYVEHAVVPEDRISEMAKMRDAEMDSIKDRLTKVEERALTGAKLMAFFGGAAGIATVATLIITVITQGHA